MHAIDGGNVELVKLLAKGGYPASEKLIFAASRGHTEAVEIMLNLNADPDSRDERQWNALMWAAKNGHTATVQLLLKTGLDINSMGSKNWTPLMLAAGGGHA
ncbi:MAG: hypothetical protein Ct9H90mP8_0270 [Pseudomonadota bacterium]|nr:MAG: hypothetical protein Ct9H90mP8_0270 [Pseudomonadota bacterium]